MNKKIVAAMLASLVLVTGLLVRYGAIAGSVPTGASQITINMPAAQSLNLTVSSDGKIELGQGGDVVLGGRIHNIQESFDEGISVDGTQVISGTGVITGTVSPTGLATFTSGFVSQSSSTVVGTSTVTGLSRQAGFLSTASSTVVGAFTGTGAASFGSTLGSVGLFTPAAGFVSQSSSTVVGALTATGAFSAATSTLGGATFYVDPLNKNISVNTSTAVLADLYVYSGSTSVSSTVAVGDSLNTTNRGTLCFWNGTNYTLMYFLGDATPVYATSAACTN